MQVSKGQVQTCKVNLSHLDILVFKTKKNIQIQVFHFLISPALALSLNTDALCFVIYSAMPLLLHFFL